MFRPSLIRRLARAHLAGGGVHHARDVNPDLRDQAIASMGQGCDHTAGEQLVAVLDDRIHHGPFLGALVTDRRYAWRNMQGQGSVAWADVERIDVLDSLLVEQQHCELVDGTRLRIPPTGVDLTPFFRALAALPTQPLSGQPSTRQRSPSTPPMELAPVSADDPTGARAASAAMYSPDPRHLTLYEWVWHLYSRDGASIFGRDLTARVTLLHRTAAHGRGGPALGDAGGRWLSPLGARDLFHAISIVLGPPQPTGEKGEILQADFDIPESWRRSAALDLDPLQRQALSTAGFGHDIRRIRFAIRDAAPGSTFSVLGHGGGRELGGLELQNPKLLWLIHRALLVVEHQVMVRRVLAGFDTSVGELLAQPIEHLAGQCHVDPAEVLGAGVA
ncbi:MAG: hypothetical protein KC731_36235 [Myxococcales bacterium]|nr:hypothetical protein [Myxococcales bacterium]